MLTIHGVGASLEWVTSCPPPRHNFTSLPPIRSERPAFDLHHPDASDLSLEARQEIANFVAGKGK